jgi:predicted nucleotide-binding protein
MMKSKAYYHVKFPPEVICEAAEILFEFIEEKHRKNFNYSRDLKITMAESWKYDNDEEFFADYRKEHYDSYYSKRICDFDISIGFGNAFFQIDSKFYSGKESNVSVKAPTRQQIEAVFEIFEKSAEQYKLPLPPEPSKPKLRVFIGHGHSEQWKELKDHLHEKHEYDIEAYEIGARAGHTIRDILEKMLDSSSFAVIVMTGEDEDKDGKMHARQNVIHELGLFQGRLGFGRAIVLLEDGTEEFSNIHGIHQIRYGKGNIIETFGDVLATLKRESK